MTTGAGQRTDALRVALEDETNTRVTYLVDSTKVFIETGGCVPANGGDAELALALIPALRGGRPVELDLPRSATGAANLPSLQAIFGSWLDATPVEVSGPASESTSRGTQVASFFSGGVDSFYTALRHAPELDALIFVHGFDIPIDDQALGSEAIMHARMAANALGKELIEVRTDLRKYLPLGEDWGFTHGAAMAAVAQSLRARFGKVYIPSTYTYKDMFPWGSHPMTDPLWSGAVEVVHDGADATRMDKLAHLADQQVAADHLRVCWENRGGRFNCCECEKCTRTMIALRVLGVLDDFKTFDRPLDLNRVRFGVLRDTAQTTFTRQVLRQIEAAGTDPDLAKALRWRLRVGPARHAISTQRGRVLAKLPTRSTGDKDPLAAALKDAPAGLREMALLPRSEPMPQRVQHALFVLGSWSIEERPAGFELTRERVAALVR